MARTRKKESQKDGELQSRIWRGGRGQRPLTGTFLSYESFNYAIMTWRLFCVKTFSCFSSAGCAIKVRIYGAPNKLESPIVGTVVGHCDDNGVLDCLDRPRNKRALKLIITFITSFIYCLLVGVIHSRFRACNGPVYTLMDFTINMMAETWIMAPNSNSKWWWVQFFHSITRRLVNYSFGYFLDEFVLYRPLGWGAVANDDGMAQWSIQNEIMSGCANTEISRRHIHSLHCRVDALIFTFSCISSLKHLLASNQTWNSNSWQTHSKNRTWHRGNAE